MTKRRPSWSDRLGWAGAILCGLLWLNVSLAWAAKPGALVLGKQAAKKPLRSTHQTPRLSARKRRHEVVAAEIVTAEIVEAETPGLRGAASFYGRGFKGRRTATGEVFNGRDFTAASNRFPLGTSVAVSRLDNERCVIVKINDRMHARHRQRIIDVSRGAAEYLDMIRAGVILVRVAPLPKGGAPSSSLCLAAFEAAESCADCLPLQTLPSLNLPLQE